MATIDLDVCTDDDITPTDVARLLAHAHNLTLNVIAEEGPGGGWPVCRFTGTRKDIASMLLEFTGGDAEEASFLAEDIKE